MNKLIAGVVLGISLASLAHGSGDPEKGEELAGSCAACHGSGGAEPIQDVYPKIADLGETYLYRQLMYIQDGDREIAEMAGQLDGMDDEDLRDLAAYFSEQEATVGRANPDLVDAGRSLYRGGNLSNGIPACSACHGPAGKGNGPAGYPRLSGQNADYIVKQLEEYRSGERDGGTEASIMVDIAQKLRDDEIEAVSSYIQGLY